MDDRIRKTINQLKALDLDGDSNENLSSICDALHGGKPDFGWTKGACEWLRDALVGLFEQFDPTCWADSYLDEVGLMRLPVDADGEAIHLGDRVDPTENLRGLTVIGVGTSSVHDSDMGAFVRDDDGYTWFNARFLRHYHKPTFEDIVRDMLNDVVCTFDASGGCSAWMTDTKVADYADRFREVMADE